MCVNFVTLAYNFKFRALLLTVGGTTLCFSAPWGITATIKQTQTLSA